MFLRCACNWGASYSLHIARGYCETAIGLNNNVCLSNEECYLPYFICMDLSGDGIKQCTSIPIIYYYIGIRYKQDINGTNCSNSQYLCNQWKNLVCRYPGNTCQCFDEFYYYNGTMCVNGQLYGQTCTSSSVCVPSSAGFVCSLPYVGASFSVCRCSYGTQYFDTNTRLCTPLKSYNASCRDSSECSGCTSGSIYCGYGEGGSIPRCLCTDNYYSNGSTCVPRISFNGTCTSTYQCYTYLNLVCLNTNRCGCSSGLYFNSTYSSCQQLKYSGDPCVLGIECWSGTCSSASICI